MVRDVDKVLPAVIHRGLDSGCRHWAPIAGLVASAINRDVVRSGTVASGAPVVSGDAAAELKRKNGV